MIPVHDLGLAVECVHTGSLVSRSFYIGILPDLNLCFSPDFVKHYFLLPLPG